MVSCSFGGRERWIRGLRRFLWSEVKIGSGDVVGPIGGLRGGCGGLLLDLV